MTLRCDLLVVAAFAPELAGFEALVAGVTLEVASGPVGIGLVAAASGTAERLVELARLRDRGGLPRGVVLVGTCGAYPESGLSVGDVISGRDVLLCEPSVVEGRAAFPDPMPVRLGAHPSMRDALALGGARLADIATTLAVTTDDALAARLAAHAAVEHLEAFAVATASAAKRVPFCAVLGVANPVGSKGRAEWRAHHDAAGRAAAGHVARWIRDGAVGLPARREG